MSTISTAYDALVTRIEAVLTTYKRLPNPYQIEQNSSKLLELGYGIAIGPATGVRAFNKTTKVSRDFTVSLTRKFISLQSDASGRSDVEKLLMEDQLLVMRDLEDNITLNGSVMDTSYVSDTGIQFVLQESEKFISIQTIFNLKYLETFT